MAVAHVPADLDRAGRAGAGGGYRQRRFDRGAHPGGHAAAGPRSSRASAPSSAARLTWMRCSRASTPPCKVEWKIAEGAAAEAGQTLFEVQGPARALLTGERTALNFLQLLSGTATAAARLRAAARGHRLPRCSTRARPSPGCARRRNTRCGSGAVKIIASGSLTGSSSRKTTSWRPARSSGPWPPPTRRGTKVPVEVEVESLDELRQAIAAGADIAMLDDFPLAVMAQAVAMNRARRAALEARGLGRCDARHDPRDRRNRRRLHLRGQHHQARARGRPVDALRVARLTILV